MPDRYTFLKLVARLRVTQLFYHYCHNLVDGPIFPAYHILFEGFYKEVTNDYDSIIEYSVSELGREAVDTNLLNASISSELSKYKFELMSADEMLNTAILIEKDLQEDLEELFEEAAIGLQNTLGGIAEDSDVRLYKLRQTIRH